MLIMHYWAFISGKIHEKLKNFFFEFPLFENNSKH